VLILGAAIIAGSGCASTQRWIMGGWVADYEVAEDRHEKTGKDVLYYFRSNSVRRRSTMEKRFRDPELRKRMSEFVRCKLFRTFEPHRRYAAQFGVVRAPALIVVHADGTYHAREGLISAEQVHAFLDEADTASTRMTVDPLVPRKLEYAWHTRKTAAEETARNHDQGVVFVLTESFTRQWSTMKKMLDHREVYVRFCNMTQCRLESWSADGRDIAAEAGVTTWPAIVLKTRDGNLQVLEAPGSYEQICHFADQIQAPVDPAVDRSASQN
jgi:hypothetical protein